MAADPLLYKGTWTLKNKFGERNLEDALKLERRLSTISAKQGIPDGKFDKAHIQSIHRHLFSSMYEWAGELRKTPLQRLAMNEYGNEFAKPEDLDKRLETLAEKVNQGLKSVSNQAEAAVFIAETYTGFNSIHPFREGNGRTGKALVLKVSEAIGYDLSLKHIKKPEWNKASKKGRLGNNQELENIFMEGLSKKELGKDPERIIGAVTLTIGQNTSKATSKTQLIETLSKANGKGSIEYLTDHGKPVKKSVLAENGIVYQLINGSKGRVLNIQQMPEIASWEKVKETLTPEKKAGLQAFQKSRSTQKERAPPSVEM